MEIYWSDKKDGKSESKKEILNNELPSIKTPFNNYSRNDKCDEKELDFDVIVKEAWKLHFLNQSDEAIKLLDFVLKYQHGNSGYYNIKAIILDNLERFDESNICYDKSLEIDYNDVVCKNKVEMLYLWAKKLLFVIKDYKKALIIIEDALSNLPEDIDDSKYWYLKGYGLSKLNEPIESHKCYLKSKHRYSEADEIDEQLHVLKNSEDILINIVGTQFYHGLKPFKKGTILTLIPEYDNEFDSDAIRVETENFGVVGHVANSHSTVIEKTLSASDIIDKIENPQKAIVLFIFLERHVIAKLIPNEHFEILQESKSNNNRIKGMLSEMDDIIDSVRNY